MGEPRSGPCEPWATEADLCSPCDGYTFDGGLMAEALQDASELLFMWSGRRFPGACETTVRPCTRRSYRHGVGRIACGCQRRDPCSCNDPDAITLGGYPLISVEKVRIRERTGGALVELDPARYRVDDYRYLVRLPDADGTNPGWPCSQDLSQDAAGDGVYFDVELTYGRTPPTSGVRAAAALACQLALACNPETAGKCQLPKRAQTIARQGITVTMVEPAEFFGGGRTGIREVDFFLDAYNPHRLTRRATVSSPDVGRRIRRVDT